MPSPQAVEDFGEQDGLRLPGKDESPLQAVLRRVVIATAVLSFVVLLVYVDRDGYKDVDEQGLTLLDAVYYATVSLSTTGYGDITPLTQQARLVNVLVITPLRILFLIVLVGTTLEVLTARTREQFRNRRWRKSVRRHTVVVGYGTKGRSAVKALVADGYAKERIVVVDPDPATIVEANEEGLVGVVGDATRRAVLEQARVGAAERVLVASARDDTAVLVVLTVRQLNRTAPIISTVRESENAPLVRQSGATSVVVSSEAAGRLLAVSAVSPATGKILEDVLIPHTGLEVDERTVRDEEVGRSPRELEELVLAVLRDGTTLRFGEMDDLRLKDHDRLVVIRNTGLPEHDPH